MRFRRARRAVLSALLCVLPPAALLTLSFPSGAAADTRRETLQLKPASLETLILGPRPLCAFGPGSRYDWLDGELIPRQGLFSFYAEATEAPLRVRVEVPPAVERGRTLPAYVHLSEPGESLLLALSSGEEGYGVTVKGFPLDDGFREWMFLLGIPSTAAPGAYALSVRGWCAGGPQAAGFFVYLKTVQVRYRRFRSETIAFDRSLAELFTSDDPRKQREGRQLRELTASFHARSVYSTAAFVDPLPGARTTAWFADRRLYRFAEGGSARSLHTGVDLAAPEGTPVSACAAGRVLLAGERLLTGYTVVIEHLPGVYSLYYHLSRLAVSKGQRVFGGQEIGAVGMTGLATGPHLHWEVRVNGVAVDPEQFLDSEIVDKSRFSQ